MKILLFLLVAQFSISCASMNQEIENKNNETKQTKNPLDFENQGNMFFEVRDRG